MAHSKYVRLKRFDPRRRHLLRTYALGKSKLAPNGLRFEEKRGWYPVSDAVAHYLESIHQTESDPDSPLAFDICTLAQAQAIDAKEKTVADRRAGVVEPNDLTSADVSEKRAVPTASLPIPRIPKAQKGIRRGVRKPSERSTRPADEDSERV